MKAYDANTLTAMVKPSRILRDFVYIRGKDSGGSPKAFGFWTGDGTSTTSVISAIDGATESRLFVGSGTIVNIPPLPFIIGLEERTVEVTLSQIHSSTNNMVRGDDIRHAVVEIHRGFFDIETGNLVSLPRPRFLGKINEIEINTPSAGNEGQLVLRCVSNTTELTRLNTARKSDETQQLRSGDRFRRYADVAGQWEIWWGELQSAGTANQQVETKRGLLGWGNFLGFL